MADYELNDHDRAELVIKFFKRYGYVILLAIIIFAVGLGVNALWQQHQETKNAAASNAYQALITSIQNGAKPQVIQAAATQLTSTYSGSVYASLAELNLAQLAVNQNDLASAEKFLKDAYEENSHDELQPIISLRLARVLLAENKNQEAIDILKDPPKAYAAAYGLLSGDAYVQLKKMDQAAQAYKEALTAANNNPLMTQLLTERINNLSAT